MTTLEQEESTRIAPPSVPAGTITLEPPPEILRAEGASNMLMMIMPALGSVGSVAMIAFGSQGSGGSMRLVFGGFILAASLGFVVVNLARQRSQHRAAITASRREYLAYLADLRESVRNAATSQRRNADWRLPDPGVLPAVAEDGTRVWERRPGDADLLHTRVGVADLPLCLTLEPPTTAPLAQLDPVSASAAHRFLLTHAVQHDVPDGIDLQAISHLEVAGEAETARALLRAVMCHLATFTSPADLRIAVVTSPANAAQWEWVKWLPHAWSPAHVDGAGPRRVVVPRLVDLEDLAPLTGRRAFSPLADEVAPHLLVVVDGVPIPLDHPLAGGVQSVTVATLPERWGTELPPFGARLLLRGGGDEQQVEVIRTGLPSAVAVPDQLSLAEAEALARRLTRRGLPSEDDGPAQEAGVGELTDLLGLPDVRDLDVATAWAPRSERDRLRVPFGTSPSGAPVYLDIKESAEGGMGPHGLIIGATGSGKSEVLRTLVLALTLTHSPEDLNLVLIDFKGGATFSGMSELPHVSAVITNLSEELTLVDRMQEALQGELTRRQELLRSAGQFTNVAEYEKARRTGGRTDLAPLPTLLIVSDEFSEMLTAKPEFADLFAAIGRLGRSLRVHLLLSSQRLEEGRLRGLESHLSYRIGLRTFSATESRQVLGVPDAHTLPPQPGGGYLRPDPATLQRFRAAYVSAPPAARGARIVTERGTVEVDLAPFTADLVPVPGAGTTAAAAAAASLTEAPVEKAPEAPTPDVPASEKPKELATFDIAVDTMAGQGMPAHRVWLPPLEDPATFDELAPDLGVDPEIGLHSAQWRALDLLPIGITDIPLEQRRETFTISLEGASGNVGVVGGPRTGKSTALRTIVTALALTRSPIETQIYVVDFGGGTFGGMRDLPHLAAVALRGEEDVLRRAVAEVAAILDNRERYFSANGIDTFATYAQRRTPGGTGPGTVDDGYGQVVLVVDGWSTLKGEQEDLATKIQAIAGRGLTFGIHVMVSASRWMDFRAAFKDVLGTRIELRLGETTDSIHRRRVADTVPAGRPGRGLTPAGRPMLIGLPRLDGDSRDATLGLGVADLVSAVGDAWTGPTPPKLRLLPSLVTLEEVRALTVEHPPAVGENGLLLGIDETALKPVALDPAEDRLLYLFGDSDSGKSSFLRLLAREAIRVSERVPTKLFVVDVRRAMLGEIAPEHLGGYWTSQEQAMTGVAEIAEFLKTRLPGPDITPAQLRARSWWTGAEVLMLVDDYDLVATSQGNALASIVPLLPHAHDVGLRLVLTRRSGGAARAAYDPVIQSMRDLASPAILLSGDPQEGGLVGNVRAAFADPGRAQLIRRDGRSVIQLAYDEPTT